MNLGGRDFTTQDFRIKEKNGANLFISSKQFPRPFKDELE
jgi:hypothetical protein